MSTRKIKNQKLTNLYLIKDGKIKPQVDLKGSLPNNGIIYINDNCEISLRIDDNKHNAIKDINNDNVTYDDCTSNNCASKQHIMYTEVLSKIESAVNSWKEEFPGEMPPNGKSYKIALQYFKQRGLIDFDLRNPINNLCIADEKDVEIINNNGKIDFDYNIYDSDSSEFYCKNNNLIRDIIIKSDSVVEYNVGDTFTAPDFTVFNTNGSIDNKSTVSVSYSDSNGNTVSEIDMSRPGEWIVWYGYEYSKFGMMSLLKRRGVEVIVK